MVIWQEGGGGKIASFKRPWLGYWQIITRHRSKRMKTGPMSMAIKMRRTTPDDIEGNNIFTSMKVSVNFFLDYSRSWKVTTAPICIREAQHDNITPKVLHCALYKPACSEDQQVVRDLEASRKLEHQQSPRMKTVSTNKICFYSNPHSWRLIPDENGQRNHRPFCSFFLSL
jgi:hypothetical protein